MRIKRRKKKKLNDVNVSMISLSVSSTFLQTQSTGNISYRLNDDKWF